MKCAIFNVSLLLCCATYSYGGSVLFNNFGPSDAFGNTEWSVGAGNQEVATRFVVPVGGPFMLSEIDLPARLQQPGTDLFTLAIANDVGGLPGTDLETFQFTNILTGNPSIVVATSATHPILASGTSYWITMIATDPTEAAWIANNTGDFSDGTNSAWAFGGGWSLFPAAGIAIPTFRVTGSEVTTVPEPGACQYAFISCAALALMFRRIKKLSGAGF
jgi:hypothetical protein